MWKPFSWKLSLRKRRLVEILRPLYNLRVLAFVLATVEGSVFKKFVRLVVEEKLLSKLERFTPRFSIPEPDQSDPPPWGQEDLERLYSIIGNRLRFMDIHGWNGYDMWHYYNNMDPATEKKHLLPKLEAVITSFGESQFLLKLPSRLYLAHWGGKELSLLIGILKRFSSTLKVVDISWAVDLREEYRGLREPLPTPFTATSDHQHFLI